MAKRRDRMIRCLSREHDNLMMMTTFRGNTPCVTAATDSMADVAHDEDKVATWVYLPLETVVRDIVSQHDNRTISELRKIVNDAVRKGFSDGVADRRRSKRL